MRYCVVWQDGWRVALLHGLLKQPEPGVYRTVREACAESDRRNMALEATSRVRTPDSAA